MVCEGHSTSVCKFVNVLRMATVWLKLTNTLSPSSILFMLLKDRVDDDKCVTVISSNNLVGGDFNFHLNPLIDRFPAESGTPSKRARALTDTCFIDVWRTVHPNLKEFTIFSNAHKSSSRIDYFFILKLMLSSILSCDIGTICYVLGQKH